MSKISWFDIIRKPLVTEKSNSFEKFGKYVFVVNKKSSKIQIKEALEGIFKIKVKKLNIININGKVKVFKGTKGKRSSYKKVIITVKDKQKIEFSRNI